MSYETSNEDDYYDDMLFAFDLKSYAREKGIRLGEFIRCVEHRQIKAPSNYIITFSRVHEKGFYEVVTAIVTENNGSFQFHISADPI